ncbi:ATP-grasp domain-containing protein [Microvirga tunisiensis]|uniref:ATP-grasp domain-containing protein n=1 Tax=Microvirga tunisiensis TaxID=2108360 RepID=A0A5N7MSC5_9HYPH|nr:hypothetical protein [Microvirga tunisiensis]MPR11939.1 hypothetical protein [Microvirga tunisiensis]MPR29897.1 hypothetical protein [Microvirga tunisiensis]
MTHPILSLTPPSHDELRAIHKAWYERVGATFLDQWPDELRQISIPTKFVEWPKGLSPAFFDGEKPPAEFAKVAEEIDRLCDWNLHFVRLNSRSPKDVTHPQPPFTNSGRQALYWIRGSERCIDDLCRFERIDPKAYICLRPQIFFHERSEFRCFVKDGQIIAVTQYNPGYFKHLQVEETRIGIRRLIDAWFSSVVKPRLHLQTVVVDLVFDYDNNLILLEINPYGLSDPRELGSYEGVESFTGAIAVQTEEKPRRR